MKNKQKISKLGKLEMISVGIGAIGGFGMLIGSLFEMTNNGGKLPLYSLIIGGLTAITGGLMADHFGDSKNYYRYGGLDIKNRDRGYSYKNHTR